MPNACFFGVRCSPRRAPLHLPQSEGIGLVGFEPTACRRGDRSIADCRAPLCPGQSYSIARVVLFRCEWQRLHSGLESTAVHVSLSSTRQRCGGECGLPNSHKNRRSVVRFSRCVARNNKTSFNFRCLKSGWWDLNPRPVAVATALPKTDIGLVGFEPTISWSRTRRDTKLRYSPKWNTHSGVRDRCAPYFAHFCADGKAIEFLTSSSG